MRTAQRRHNDDKVLKQRLMLPRNRWARDNLRWQGIRRTTGTTCSCIFCRPRRYSGSSIQERRQIAWMEM